MGQYREQGFSAPLKAVAISLIVALVFSLMLTPSAWAEPQGEEGKVGEVATDEAAVDGSSQIDEDGDGGTVEEANGLEDAQANSLADDDGQNMDGEPSAIEDEGQATQGPENSWRYEGGVPVDNGIAPLARSASNAWQWTPNGYTNSIGGIIDGAVSKGIDVSQWQGKIDWQAVKNDGIDFAIIRCGYGDNDSSQDDTWWKYNVSECERLGIPYGVYIYSYATDTKHAASEAAHVLRLLKGHSPVLPVYLDMEDNSMAGLSTSTLASIASTFCNAVTNAGYRAGVYANLTWWNEKLTSSVFSNWDRWVAQWNYQCDYAGAYGMWQCSDKGSVDGISGNVDVDFLMQYTAGVNSQHVTSFSGATRFDTAAMIAKAAYSSADCAVIAADGGWPDALAGASLAGLMDCPILLTSKSGLSQETRNAISQLGISHVIVLGGPLVIDDKVISDLKGISGMQVERLAGATRQDTQMMVYEYGKTKVKGASWSDDMVCITSGYRFPDALSFSPLAFRDNVPIFLVDESGNLTSKQKSVLQQDGYANPVVLGGPLVMSNDSVSFANKLASLSGNSNGAKRIAGDTQYDTSAQIAQWLASSKGFSWDKVAFTTGNLPYDALTGSVLQGKNSSTILVVDHSWDAGVSEAIRHKSDINTIQFFGGELAIPGSLRTYIVARLF